MFTRQKLFLSSFMLTLTYTITFAMEDPKVEPKAQPKPAPAKVESKDQTKTAETKPIQPVKVETPKITKEMARKMARKKARKMARNIQNDSVQIKTAETKSTPFKVESKAQPKPAPAKVESKDQTKTAETKPIQPVKVETPKITKEMARKMARKKARKMARNIQNDSVQIKTAETKSTPFKVEPKAQPKTTETKPTPAKVETKDQASSLVEPEKLEFKVKLSDNTQEQKYLIPERPSYISENISSPQFSSWIDKKTGAQNAFSANVPLISTYYHVPATLWPALSLHTRIDNTLLYFIVQQKFDLSLTQNKQDNVTVKYHPLIADGIKTGTGKPNNKVLKGKFDLRNTTGDSLINGPRNMTINAHDNLWSGPENDEALRKMISSHSSPENSVVISEFNASNDKGNASFIDPANLNASRIITSHVILKESDFNIFLADMDRFGITKDSHFLEKYLFHEEKIDAVCQGLELYRKEITNIKGPLKAPEATKLEIQQPKKPTKIETQVEKSDKPSALGQESKAESHDLMTSADKSKSIDSKLESIDHLSQKSKKIDDKGSIKKLTPIEINQSSSLALSSPMTVTQSTSSLEKTSIDKPVKTSQINPKEVKGNPVKLDDKVKTFK